ncbi:MAG TPA: PDZ domain-containing protein [Planctomycetaceae bacterium]|nr:PDZ domain-containing protein [Planctomycetaceae bacterium]
MPFRLILFRMAIAASIVAARSVVSTADGPDRPKASIPEPLPGGARVTILHGRVTNENGQPVAGAVVYLDRDPTFQAKSDVNGAFRVRISGVVRSKAVYVTAMKPVASGRVKGLMGTSCWCQIAPGSASNVDLTVTSPLYLAGTVVDERGQPISDACITANTTASGYVIGAVAKAMTKPDGSFEIFNYSPPREANANGEWPTKGLSASHPDYLEVVIENPHAIKPNERDKLRIVLKDGRKVSGTLLDAAGKPALYLTIRATCSKGSPKVTETDERGKFALRGLADGPTLLTSVDRKSKQTSRVSMAISGDRSGVTVRLQPMQIPKDLQTYSVLDMRLADVTPELRSAYDLRNQQGVMVLDPGKNSDSVSWLSEEGDVLWAVGTEPVRSVRDFLEKTVAIASEEGADGRSIDVWIAKPERAIRTHLQVTAERTQELRGVLDQCIAADQRAILAVAKLGAQFRFTPANSGSDPDRNLVGPEVDIITLGGKWKGGDADLRQLSTIPFAGLYVRGQGKVSDRALADLKAARPDINVDRVSEAYLGAGFRPDEKNRPQVVAVCANSPAARAGLREGDVIQELAGKPVPDFAAVRAVTFTLKPGQTVTAKVLREGKTFELTIELSGWD